ncbi:MAG: FtsX-like permease family protein [Bacteroidales bacterium]
MKSYIKFLSRNKLYTFINILGLSISLMFVILIANYVVRNLTIDKNVVNKERIYAIANEKYIGTGFWNGQHLKARYPNIEEACIIIGTNNITLNIGDKEYSSTIMFADTTFFDMFSIKLIEGDSKAALISKNNVVISKNFANKVFGTFNPIGQTIKFINADNVIERVVVGIMPNIDNSILPNADIVTNSLNIKDYNSSITSEQMNNAGAASLFLLEKEGANLISKTDDILAFFKTYFWPYSKGASKEVNLVPFNDIYFSDFRNDFIEHGDKSFVIILISVGILILLFAVINYINLTIAQTGFRAKEMATRRLLGSSRSALFSKLILESLVMCLIAFIIGLLLAVACEQYTNDLLQSKISILKDFNGAYLISYIVLVVFVSTISGIIPAVIISNFKPIEVVRGAFRRKTSMIYGKILITFQNIITIALIAGSITMLWQINHLINAPMGYNYKNIIDISTGGFKNFGQITSSVSELKKLPFVETIGMGCGTPLDGGNNNTISFGKEKMISFQTFIGDEAYYKILDLKIKRDNKALGQWFFNEYAFKEMEIGEEAPNVKMGSNFEEDITIAGIFYDFRVGSALREPTACKLMILKSFEENTNTSSLYYPWNILVKINDNYDKESAFTQVRNIMVKFTGSSEIYMDYMENYLKEYYKEQRRTSNIVMIFTLIAILISSLGLLAMSTYFIQQRKMEIAVRKVFGSTREEVLKRLVNNFMKLVIIAFIISLPIVWYFMEWWLEGYTYRISISPLIFLGAGILSSLIALITVYWQSINAANKNPVDSIKG